MTGAPLTERPPGRSRALSATARRLRLRVGVRAGVIGLWVGVGVGLIAELALRLVGMGWWSALPAILIPIVAGFLSFAGGLLLARRWTPRELALFVDQAAGTGETLVTAEWLDSDDSPLGFPEKTRLDIEAQAEKVAATLPPGRELAPVRLPRNLLAVPLVWALVLPLLFVPALVDPFARVTPVGAPTTPKGLAIQTLEERLGALQAEDAEALPPEVRREVNELIEDLKGEEVTSEEAKERLAELGKTLDEQIKAQEATKSVVEDLEEAAKRLGAEQTQGLKEALESGDPAGAAKAAEQLAKSLETATPEEKAQAAKSLREAGERLAQSSDPAAQQLGEAMKQAGGAPQAGQQGAEGAEPGANQGMTPEKAQELAKALQDAKGLGERLKQDKQSMQRLERMRAATERAKEQLDQDAKDAKDGEGGKEGEGEGEGNGEGKGKGKGGNGESGEGEGEGEGEGDGGGGEGDQKGGSKAGKGHTWEDQGTSKGQEGHQSEDRNGKREGEGGVVNDFERLYEGARIEGAEGLLTAVDGEINENGKIDTLDTRITGSDERSALPTVNVPAGSAPTGEEAVRNETVPPGYREAVKQYFDGMK
jgi:hypothetical protein